MEVDLSINTTLMPNAAAKLSLTIGRKRVYAFRGRSSVYGAKGPARSGGLFEGS